MKTTLPALFAAISLALAPVPSFAEKGGNGRGNGNGNGGRGQAGFCPPGLADRSPSCVPPGQARQGRRDNGDPPPEVVVQEVLDEIVSAGDRVQRADRGNDAEAGLAIVGALVGLAMIERASRQREAEDPPEPAPAAAPAPWTPPEIPARPESFALLSQPEPPVAEAPIIALPDAPEAVAETRSDAEEVPAASTSLIPPPPPLADDLTPTSQDLADAFARAQESGDTGF